MEDDDYEDRGDRKMMATAAMIGILAGRAGSGLPNAERTAKTSVDYADALIAQLKKEKSDG